MAEPLVLSFQADTSRATSAMQSLAASVIGNMAAANVALSGGAANLNLFGGSVNGIAQNVKKAAAAMAGDVLNISRATAGAASKDAATLQGIVSTFTASAASSATAQATVKAGLLGTSSALTSLVAQVPGLALIGSGVLAAFAAFGLVSAAVGQANDQLDRFVKLGADAEKAGVGVEFFQRFSEAAKDAKISADEIEAALKRAGQAVTPKFEQPDAIKNQLSDVFDTGYTGDFKSKGLADYRAAPDNEGRIRAVVTAMQELRDLGLQVGAIDLADKLFGSEVAERIRSGRLDIDAIATALDRKREDLISREQTQQAEEFRNRLNEAYEEIDKALHVSVALAGAGDAINNIWLKIAENTAKAATAAATFLERMGAAAKAAIDAQPPSARQSPLTARLPGEGEGNLAADLGAEAGRGARGRTIYESPIGPERTAGTIANAPLPPRRPLSLFTDERVPHDSKGSGGAAEADPVATFVGQIEKSAAALKAETDAFGKSNAEKTIAINLAKAQAIAEQNGTKVTAEQTEQIRRASEQTASYKGRLEDLEQKQRQNAEAARFFGQAATDGLADIVLEGRNASDVLLDLEKSIARAALQSAVLGTGPLAGLFGTAPLASAGSNATGGLLGTLLGSFRANGGPVEAGRPYTVGEMGRELFVPDSSGRVIPIGHGGGGGSSGPVNVYNYAGGQAEATAQRRSDGGVDVIVEQLDNALASRAGRGRGALSAAFSGGRRLRG